ncbi:MAG: hypothetical protein HQK65_07930, partial [Desulfamplus sp.]|nr:hypothetical protein [Desulfamplus sp.]
MKTNSKFNNSELPRNCNECLIRYLLSFILTLNLTVSAYADKSNILGTNATRTASKTYPKAESLKKVESLKISWHGYILGRELNSSQKDTARKNKITSSTSKDSTATPSGAGTYKFRDKDLNIVADSKTDRVLI